MHDNSLSWALNEWLLWGACQALPVLVKPLLGGLTNKSYLINSQGSLLVLRVFAENSAELDLDRKVEQTAIRLASAAGLSPHLIFLDPHCRYSVTQYVEGGLLSESDYSERKKIDDVAVLLSHLHSIDIKHHHLPVLDVVEKAERYWAAIIGQGQHKNIEVHKAALQAYFTRQVIPCKRLALCHNDPVASNFLVANAGLRLIDWEYASAGNPLFDLAAVIHNEQLSEVQEQLFLNQYSVECIPAKDLERAKREVRYLEWLWWMVQGERAMDESTRLTLAETQGQLLLHIDS